jgi:long-chain acyl-CoA synthetase
MEIIMERIWMKNWPEDVSPVLNYRLGEKPLHEYLLQNARDYPDKIAYIFYGQEIKWGELATMTKSFANYLVKHGIKKGNRVALFMQNCPQYVIAHYGIQMIGGIVTPCSPMFKEWELEYELNDAGVIAIITTDDLYPVLEKIRNKTHLKEIVVTNYRDMMLQEPTLPIPDELTYERKYYTDTRDFMQILKEHPAEVPAVEIDIWNDVAMMIYTSGTTGQPKGAMLTYGNTLAKIASTFQVRQAQSTDITLSIMPIFHIAGNVAGVAMPIYGGTTCVLLMRFDPLTVIKAFKLYRCVTWHSVTPMLLAIMDNPAAKEVDWTSLRLTTCTSFGVTLTEEIAKTWEKFVGSRIVEGSYGLTETNTCDSFMPPIIKWGSCGIPTIDTDVRIIDLDTGRELDPGEQGQIVIRNAGVFKGYWNNDERTAETLKNGWVYTGDIGMIDHDGYIWFIGRMKEMIKCSGYSVFPEDVETLLMNHPAVQQVAVIGISDPMRGESVKAFIVLKPEQQGKVTEEDIISWSRQKMAAYKYPRAVEFRDSLPTAHSGKVLRRMLNE